MSKADQLIEAFWHKEEYLREAAMYYPAESGSRRTLLEVADLIAHFRDAVNEKPHEPTVRESHERILSGKGAPADYVNILGDPTQSVSVGPASPPHAAAEPVGQPTMDKARREWIRDLRAYASGSGGTRIDSGECVELAELLDASPAQPIAREPPQEWLVQMWREHQVHAPVAAALWRSIHALKSAGKEST